MIKKDEKLEVYGSRDYMANERTFLAWIRTSIGIMAFGFVVEKFALFLKQLSFLLTKSGLPEAMQAPSGLQGHSSIFGIFVVGLGALIGVLSFIKYKRVEKQMEEGSYNPSTILEIMLVLSVLSVGIFLIVYLTNSI
jgi:uncharacterized membrane protein YidH (DUF202 family)